MKYLYNITHALNNSKLFAGMVMIMLNIGSKYITIKLSKSQEAFLKHVVGREFLVFAVCWMGSRDIFLSFILTAIFTLLTEYILHEDSKYCILSPKYTKELIALIDTDNDGQISQKEMDRAIGLLSK
jgi:hypothetical protein